jgi:CheY-like chemotaxis protein
LVKELHAMPERVDTSSLHTASQAVNSLASLSTKSEQPAERKLSSPLILVVDDEAVSRETMCRALERAQLRAFRVYDPLLALKLAEENRFDLIFMDVQMPGINGFDACKRILGNSLNAKTPIVFVTSLNDPQTRVRFGTSGGTDFIGKPIWPIEVAVKALTYLLRD